MAPFRIRDDTPDDTPINEKIGNKSLARMILRQIAYHSDGEIKEPLYQKKQLNIWRRRFETAAGVCPLLELNPSIVQQTKLDINTLVIDFLEQKEKQEELFDESETLMNRLKELTGQLGLWAVVSNIALLFAISSSNPVFDSIFLAIFLTIVVKGYFILKDIGKIRERQKDILFSIGDFFKTGWAERTLALLED